MGLLSIYFLSSPKITAEVSSSSSHVSIFKNWTVEFSRQMDPSTITDEDLYVLNESNEKMPISYSWQNNGRSLQIHAPEEGYQYNAFYRLIISQNLTSVNGEKLSKPFNYEFQTANELPSIKDEKHLNKLLVDRSNQQSMRFGALEATEGVTDESSSSTGDSNTSKTNVQVEGIDEADIVKIDGNHIYFVREEDIIVATADNENSKLVSIIKEDKFRPVELYIDEDKLIVIGHKHEQIQETTNKSEIEIYPNFRNQMTTIIYDITDKENPSKIREVSTVGSYVSSRIKGDYIYLIANHMPDFYILREMDGNEDIDLRPSYMDTGLDGKQTRIPYENIHYLPESNESQFLILTSINLNDLEQEANIKTYLGTSNDIYMSSDYLYTTVRKYPNLDESSTTRIGFQSMNTEIVQFEIDEGSISFHASTVIEGTLVNQFAMDERNGTFRVATTKMEDFENNQESMNNLYTFDLHLNRIGSLEGLAEGEQIYSVRFMEDRAYMVTFEQIDPLFVIDLQDPTSPTVLGELKIPGFSNYLHPINDDFVIGFGQNTKLVERGEGREPIVRQDGLKLSLFNIQDVTNPTEMDTEIIGGAGSYSDLNYNHKALYVHPDEPLYGFPLTIFEEEVGQKEDREFIKQSFEFEGQYLYSITPEEGISLKETFTHQKGNLDYPDWHSQMKRLVSKDEIIYGLSHNKISVYDLHSGTTVQTIDLPVKEKEDYHAIE